MAIVWPYTSDNAVLVFDDAEESEQMETIKNSYPIKSGLQTNRIESLAMGR
jgi:hypothetical protein